MAAHTHTHTRGRFSTCQRQAGTFATGGLRPKATRCPQVPTKGFAIRTAQALEVTEARGSKIAGLGQTVATQG